MKLYKQVKRTAPTYSKAPWWCDFTVDGKRYRLTTDTANKVDALKEAKKKEAQANQGKLSANSQSFARLTFTEAADKYLAGRKLELQASSLTKERQLLVKLKEHFGTTRLNRITVEMIRDYREQRGTTCGPALLNMEIGVLRRILKRAKLWHQFSDEIKPLREPQSIGRALTSAQKTALLETAATRAEWQTAYLASVIALNTSMRRCELLALQWQDIDLAGETLTIRKSKTEAGERVLPLTADCFEALVNLRDRAELFGVVLPEHYIFARFRSVARFDGKAVAERRILEFDPSTPVKGWRTAWRKLTAKAGLKGLRFHDMRHTVLTDLLTNPNISIQTAKSIAGHIDERMVRRYAHIHLETKREAIQALAMPPKATTLAEESTLPC